MPDHHCNKDREIGEIHSMLTALTKQIYGNGQKGLASTVPELNTRIDSLTIEVQAQTKVIADLVQFQAGINSVREYKRDNRSKTAIIVSSIIGVCGIVSAIILKLL